MTLDYSNGVPTSVQALVRANIHGSADHSKDYVRSEFYNTLYHHGPIGLNDAIAQILNNIINNTMQRPTLNLMGELALAELWYYVNTAPGMGTPRWLSDLTNTPITSATWLHDIIHVWANTAMTALLQWASSELHAQLYVIATDKHMQTPMVASINSRGFTALLADVQRQAQNVETAYGAAYKVFGTLYPIMQHIKHYDIWIYDGSKIGAHT